MPIFRTTNSLGISPIRIRTGHQFKSSIFPLHPKPPYSAATLIRAAATLPTSPPVATAASGPQLREPGQRRRRPVCAVCTKPLRVCLCGRLRGPPLDTAVGVTVLQHPTEARHPLSSVRVARLGLRNLAVAQVADVAHRASFLLTTNLGLGGGETGNAEAGAAIGEAWAVETMDDKCSIAYTETQLMIDVERGVGANPKIRWPSRCSSLAKLAVSNGFTVTKTQENKPRRSTGEEASPSPEFQQEFSIAIPPHSALLFPCQRATTIDAASDRQVAVKHLIVLDGTWAKAHRMYHENPWLQLVPHVKLEPDGVTSLYGEVRHEPRAGCLSTIESIVAAMKELGEDETELDRVLVVFESMIADQRRCKDENWKP